MNNSQFLYWRALRISSLLVFAGLLYSKVFLNEYLWDDWTLFINNPDLRLGAVTWSKLSAPILPGTTYFRPVVLASFALEFHTLGVNAVISHAINWLSYLAIVWLTFLVATLCFKRLNLDNAESRGLLAALIYAAHPALVESTAWSAGRFDLFATLFFLGAIYLNLRFSAGWHKASVVGAIAALSMGSKETGLMLPVVLFVLLISFEQKNGGSPGIGMAIKHVFRSQLPTWVTLLAVSIGYLSLREIIFHKIYHVNTELSAAVSDSRVHVLLSLQACAFYAKTAALPFLDIGIMHPIPELMNLKGILVSLLGALLLLIIFFRSFHLRPTALLLFAAFLTLLPVLHIIPLTIGDNIGQERFLVLPLVFVAMGVASFQAPAWTQTHLIKLSGGLLLVGWLLLATFTTFTTIPAWRNDLTLWQWTHTKHPESDFVSYGLISAAFLNGRPDLASPILAELQAKGPLNGYFQIVYGDYLSKTGREREGVDSLQAGIVAVGAQKLKEDPHQAAYAFTALAQAYFELYDYDRSLEAIREAYKYEPNRPITHILESVIQEALGHPDKARIEYNMAMQLIAPEQRSAGIELHNRLREVLCDSPTEKASTIVCSPFKSAQDPIKG